MIRWWHFPFFVLIGVFFTLAPEYLNQVFVGQSLGNYAGTMMINVVILVVFAVLWWFLSRFSWRWKAYFFLAGIFGLLFEWFFVGNHPLSPAIQLGMFAYWSCFLVLPALILVGDHRRSTAVALLCLVVAQFIIYSILSRLVAGTLLAVFGALVMTAAVYTMWWWVLPQVFSTRLRGRQYVGFFILVTLLELAIPRPFGAIIVLFLCVFAFHAVRAPMTH